MHLLLDPHNIVHTAHFEIDINSNILTSVGKKRRESFVYSI